VFALLDLVGWAADAKSREIEVDVREYGQPFKEAIDGYLPLLADREVEADANDAWRAEQGKLPREDEIIASVLALGKLAILIEQAVKESAR
jgi:hypothetical protein